MSRGFCVGYEDMKGNCGELTLHFSYDELCDDQGRILLGIIVHRKGSEGMKCCCVSSMVEMLLNLPSFSPQKNDGVQGVSFIFFDQMRGMAPNDENCIVLRNGIDVIQFRVVVAFPLNKFA